MRCKFALRPKPHLQPQPVGNHRDKFAVGGFALDARDRVAEVILEGFDVAAVKMSDFCNKKLAVINCKIKVYWVSVLWFIGLSVSLFREKCKCDLKEYR